MDKLFSVIETEVQPALVVHTYTSVGNLPQVIGKAYADIMTYLGELKERPVDMPFVAYHNLDMEKLDVEIGFPVAKALPDRGEITATIIPGGKKATAMYKGPYKEMESTYTELNKWMQENGHQPSGVVYEYYYNSPMEVEESELLTKIVFLLK